MDENCIRSTRPTAAYLLSSAAGREEFLDLLQYIKSSTHPAIAESSKHRLFSGE